MRFRILGPVEVWDGDALVSVGGPQQRALLAFLLLHPNQVVSADRLVCELWGGEPPATARRLLHGCVVRLRRVLAGELVGRAPGYLLEVRPGELDADRFDELVAAAEPLLGNRLDEAAALLTEALGLWRGPALDGITTDSCQTHARRLEERRQAVLEDLIDVDLRRGRHAELVGELRAHVQAHPLRERLWAQLMLALYGADRQADALAAYRELRTTMIDQLGVEPNATVRAVEGAILAGGDALEAYQGDAPLVPAQLPPVVAAFTGRADHLHELDSPTAITVIDGMPGVGKTALAVRWAHHARDRFPDGQLYLNLRGFATCPPVTPIEALTELLHALGVPAQRLPAEVDRAASQYRSLVADRRLLVLLDNAHSAEQVRPLLPGGDGCRVLVTSRDRLSGLVARDGATRITLNVLTPDEAMTLLEQVIGPRVHVERDEAASLARACAHLPLALRIAAATITDAPHRTIARYVTELAGAELATLAVDGDDQTGVRATFDLSYAALSPALQQLFRLLALVPGPDVTAEAASALIDADAQPLLHQLTTAHLLEENTPGRYAFHDLLRAYALEQSDPDADDALQRLHDWYLRTADRASRRLYPEKLRVPLDLPATPPFPDDLAARRWLDAERPGLVAATIHGPYRWQLADALRGYFWGNGHWADWLTTAKAGLAAAEADADLRAQAAAYLGLADAHRCRNRYPHAVDLYTRAVTLSRHTGWRESEAAAMGNLGVTYWEMGCLERAAAELTRAQEIDRHHGWHAAKAAKLSNLGLTYRQLGRLCRAAECLTEALALDRKHGLRVSEAVNLAHLGLVRCLQGDLDAAFALHTEALARQRELGNRYLIGATLRQLAVVHRDAGRYTDALAAAGTALPLTRECGNRLIEAITLATLGSVHHHLGHHEPAVDHFRQALRLGRHIGAPDPQIEALIGLAVTLEDPQYAAQAVSLAAHHGYRLLQGQALTVQAELGQVSRAEQALAIHRETGHRPGEARALRVLRRTGSAQAYTSRNAPNTAST